MELLVNTDDESANFGAVTALHLVKDFGYNGNNNIMISGYQQMRTHLGGGSLGYFCCCVVRVLSSVNISKFISDKV